MSDTTRRQLRYDKGVRNQAAYPIRDEAGRPAWQGIIVVEPNEILWRCPHAHLVDPADKGASHAEAVACAQERDAGPDAP